MDENIKNKKLGQMTKEELNKLSAKDLANKMIMQLDDIQFDVAKERQEFFKFISGFNSSRYSYRNCMILYAQACERVYMPVFASMKEWNKQNALIKSGENGLFICVPSKFNIYREIRDDKADVFLPFAFDKNTIQEREKLVKEGKLIKEQRTTFKFIPTIFSITQTNMPEEEKVKLLQRYNAHNTSEENAEVLKKETELCEKLGINVNFTSTNNTSLGFVNFVFNEIVVEKNMPVDAQISVLAHELGHYIFHRHADIRGIGVGNKLYNLSHNNREIQAQLFSHIVLEGLGVDSENEFSLKYINSYLFKNDNNDVMSLSDVGKSSLHAHLSIVHDQALNIVDLLTKESINELDIKKLLDFRPDRYYFNKETKEAVVIPYEKYLKEKEELLNKNGKTKLKAKKREMIQSM